MIQFSANISQLQPSATISLSNRVKELIAGGHDVINLTAGEPDFPTPEFIAEAGIAAIRAGHTRYTAAPGIPQLRGAIAADLQKLSPRQERIDPAGIVVSAGAKESLFNLCFTLFGPGDRVLIPVPYWTTYPTQVELARAEPVFVHGSEDRDFKVTVDDLERAATDGAAGLILNSPSNPTGAVYTLEELEQIVGWASERGIWVISDEIYRRIYENEALAPGLLDLDPALLDRAIVVDGASKAFAMTGWRIGFFYAPKEVAAKAAALQSQTTSHAAAPSQYAALAAYSASEEQNQAYRDMCRAFQKRRERVVQLFREQLPQVGFLEPRGAFYLWVRADGLARAGESTMQVCERLLNDAGIAVVPGEAFGDDRYVRLSYATSESELENAVQRLAKVVG